MGETIIAGDKLLAELAYQENSPDWNTVSDVQNGKNEFAATVNGYSDAQFKDFFFGGYSYDYSNNRMTETAPAYILMKAEVEEAGGLDENGNFKEGFGPGTEDWEGQLLMLRGQSFVRGSEYRKQTIEQQWEIRKEKYEANQKAWRDDNPEDPQWKKEGYANKGAYLKATGNTDGSDSEITDKNPHGFSSSTLSKGEIDIGPQKGYGDGKYRGTYTIDQANVLLNKIKNGTGFRFNGVNYNYLTGDDGESAWYGFEAGKDVNTATEGSLFGDASGFEDSVFFTSLPQFQNLETVTSKKVKLNNQGEPTPLAKSDLNPFDTKKIPKDFINAVGKDDNDVIDYIEGLKIPNLTISESGNYDSIVIGMGEKGKRKVKTFTVDPNMATDEDRAKEIWNWMKDNYAQKKKYD